MVEIRDITILGAGLSGTALAVALISHGFVGHIHLCDRRADFSREQRWCSWGPIPASVPAPVSASWETWTVSSDGRRAVNSISERPYLHVYAPEFFSKFHAVLADQPDVSLYLGEDAKFSDRSGGRLFTEIGDRRLASDLVFDSTTPRRQEAVSGRRIRLLQSFSGAVVRTEEPVFDSDGITLMDFDVPGAEELAFVYVLPFEAHSALVESTSFAARTIPDTEHDRRVRDYLGNVGAYTVERRESGVVPMGNTTRDRRERSIPGVVRIGAAGDVSRASSGYAFVEILRESDRLARNIVAGEVPVAFRRNPRHAALDEVFLSVVRDSPSLARESFLDLFEKVPAHTLVRFLSGESGLGDEAQIIGALFGGEFIKAALKRALDTTLAPRRTAPSGETGGDP